MLSWETPRLSLEDSESNSAEDEVAGASASGDSAVSSSGMPDKHARGSARITSRQSSDSGTATGAGPESWIESWGVFEGSEPGLRETICGGPLSES